MRNNIAVLSFVVSVLMDFAILINCVFYFICKPLLVDINMVFIFVFICMLLNLITLCLLAHWNPSW